MSRLEIRLFGRFEVWHNDRSVTGFESQKVRALFVYLLLSRDSGHSRDHLAGLLWPDKDDEVARRNLRQALYNLRTTLSQATGSVDPILTSHQHVTINPGIDCWLDVEAFENAVRQGMSAPGGVDVHHLTGAVQLYRDDFLAGFFLSDSVTFEHWLLYEQERLREMVIQALRRLVDYCLVNKEYHLGIQYAHRLLEIDPLFEQAHRKLMRLYALSGQRNRALAQFETCRKQLRTELGVEPLEETTDLYHSIVAEEWPVKISSTASDERAGAPRMPLVGREKTHARLRRNWDAACRESSRLTVVEGEVGIGKTRLVEEIISQAVAEKQAIVVRGCCYQSAPPIAYQPISDAFRQAAMHEAQRVQEALQKMTPSSLSDLVRLVPELRVLRRDLAEPASLTRGQEGGRWLVEAVAQLLEALIRLPGPTGQPACSLILFLDDLHWADRSSLDFLQRLIPRLANTPTWIVVTYAPEALNLEHPLLPLRGQLSRGPFVDRVTLERLSPSAIEQIAAALVGTEYAGDLARFLDRESAGLPLTISELINYLCDEGILVPYRDKNWVLAGRLPVLATPTPENRRDLILWRVSQLPTSARRLLTLAAVVGPQFDAALLQAAEGEHMAVVDASIDLWLERRLVRPVPRQLTGNTADGVHDDGAVPGRWDRFEFTHDEIRLAIYHDVSLRRRYVMHRQVATALEARHAGNTRPVCELLAHHFTAARVWDQALLYLQQAGDVARPALADETALYYYDQALHVLDRLESDDAGEAEVRGWLRKRFEILESRAEIYRGWGAQERQNGDLEKMKAIAERLGDPASFEAVASRLNVSSRQ